MVATAVFLVIAVSLAVILRRVSLAKTQTPQRGSIVEAVYGIGTVTASKTFQLKLGVTATIKALFVKEGDAVEEGSPLLDLDVGATFRAPFGGTITAVPYKVGESVFPQAPIVTLVNLVDRYIVVSLEQQGALRVRAGQSVHLSFESIRGNKFTGHVRSIFPNGGEFFVYIDVDQFPPEILPGMTADVAIEIARRDNALLVPVSSVSSGSVVVVRNGIRRKIPVEIGTVDGEMAEVVSGDLRPDDRVVARGP